MRVLIVSQYFHPENFRINQLAQCLKAEGHQVTVLTALPNYPAGRFAAGYGWHGPYREKVFDIEVIRVPIFPRGKGRAWQLILNYLSFVFFAIVFGLPRLRGSFDVCVSWCSSPITGAIPAIVHRFLTGVPVAVWIQDLWPETFFAVTKARNPVFEKALSSLVRFIYRGVDQLWIQSPAYEDSVRRHGGRDEQIVFVPNWAEDLYDCDRWTAVEGDRIPANSLVFAGNLGRAQGLETIVAAAEITQREGLRNHWVLVGDGSLRDWLHSEVERRGLEKHVTLLPRRPVEAMPKILKSAAAVLVTLGNDEVYKQTIPSKVQSCLAAGRPVIAALGGEPARVIERAACGFVVPPERPELLAKSVQDFLNLPDEEREKLGRKGHDFYKANYTQAKVVGRISELLEKMRKK